MKNFTFEKIRTWLGQLRYRKYVIGIIIGVAAGYLYFFFVGCKTGSCPITGHSYSASMAGGLMGYLAAGMF
jgi:acid phosphatase family membrane protein YuiD